MAKSYSSGGRGPSQRQLRVGELIRRKMSEMFLRGETHDPELNALSVTVSEVRVTPDLRIATAFVLPLGGKDKKATIDALARNKWEIRKAISKELTLKFAPELRFLIDESFDRMEETRALLATDHVAQDLNKPSEEE